MVAHDYLVDRASRAGRTVASDISEGVSEARAALKERGERARADGKEGRTDDDDGGGRIRKAAAGAAGSVAERLRAKVSAGTVRDRLGEPAEPGLDRRERARRLAERVRESGGINLPEGFMDMGAREEYDAGEWPAGRPSGPPLIGLSDGFREGQPGLSMGFRTEGRQGRGLAFDYGTGASAEQADMFAEYGAGDKADDMFGGWGGFEWGGDE